MNKKELEEKFKDLNYNIYLTFWILLIGLGSIIFFMALVFSHDISEIEQELATVPHMVCVNSTTYGYELPEDNPDRPLEGQRTKVIREVCKWEYGNG